MIIAPSILAADFAHLGRDVEAVRTADWIHVDIMDGHFVPNLSFGPDITAAVHKVTDLELDVHLMISDPEQWIDHYVRAGAACIIFHVEAVADLEAARALAKEIRSRGVRAGFSVKPNTPIEPYFALLEDVDLVLIMSVEPGFGGQKFMPNQLEKVTALREKIDAEGLEVVIEIDGGINRDTIAQAAAAGCDAFVAGSAVYGHEDPAVAITELRELARAAKA